MSFAKWAGRHVADEKISKRYKKIDHNSHDYELWEKNCDVNMSIAITGLSNNFVIIDPALIGQWHVFKDIKHWGNRCDFLIIGELDDQPIAFFIELKKTMNHGEKRKAQKQLRWSRSILHFALSTYNISELATIHESDLTVKYLMVGQYSADTLTKLPTKINKTDLAYSCLYNDILINYSLADVFSLTQLLNLD